MPFCVDSPRWLATRGRYDEVAVVLAKLKGGNATSESESIHEEATRIIATAVHEASLDISWREVKTPCHPVNGH